MLLAPTGLDEMSHISYMNSEFVVAVGEVAHVQCIIDVLATWRIDTADAPVSQIHAVRIAEVSRPNCPW